MPSSGQMGGSVKSARMGREARCCRVFLRPRGSASPAMCHFWDRRGAGTPERLQRTPGDGETGLSRGALGNVAGPGVDTSAGSGSREDLAAMGHHVDGLRQPATSSCTWPGLESSADFPPPGRGLQKGLDQEVERRVQTRDHRSAGPGA